MPMAETAPVMVVRVAASEPEHEQAQADDQPDEQLALTEPRRKERVRNALRE
jgi:hypothetical protein